MASSLRAEGEVRKLRLDRHAPAPLDGPALPSKPDRTARGHFGWKRSEIEFTQCRVFRGVKRSPSNTWPK